MPDMPSTLVKVSDSLGLKKELMSVSLKTQREIVEATLIITVTIREVIVLRMEAKMEVF